MATLKKLRTREKRAIKNIRRGRKTVAGQKAGREFVEGRIGSGQMRKRALKAGIRKKARSSGTPITRTQVRKRATRQLAAQKKLVNRRIRRSPQPIERGDT